jgi:hypothetical protein
MLFLLNFLTIVTEFIGVSLALAYFGVSPYIAVPAAAARRRRCRNCVRSANLGDRVPLSPEPGRPCQARAEEVGVMPGESTSSSSSDPHESAQTSQR